MPDRLLRDVLAMGLFASLHMSGQAAAQPENHIGEAMAEIMLEAGCTMEESAIAAAMQARGLGTSDFQAQAMALQRGGYLTSDDGGRTLRLTGWGACP